MSTGATEPVRSLFVTLRRGLAGKPEDHKRVLQALGLKYPHHCVEKPNNDSIRGMLAKVPHLVIVETDRMFYLRTIKEQVQKAPRPPIVVQHGPEAATHPTLPPVIVPEPPPLPLTPPRPRPLPPPASAAHFSPQQQQHQQRQGASLLPPVARPLQSPLIAPHLAEHMAPLPGGEHAQFRPVADRPLREVLQHLVSKRADAISKHGLYHPRVAELNSRIAEARAEQVQQEEEHRRAVLEAQHTHGPHKAKVHAAGKGSRRGMLAEARAQAAARLAQRQQRQEAGAPASLGRD